MWQYQKTDDMYVGRFEQDDHLEHRNFKYIRKYMGKNGKMVYVYQKQKTSKSGNVTTTVGQSLKSKYAQVEIGKPKENWTYDDYKEKKVKIGKTTFTASNETGTLNLRVDVDNTKKKKRAASGKSIISKLFNRK